jgi:glucose/arabinose dehydrogenase
MKKLLLSAALLAFTGLSAQTPTLTLTQVANITTSPTNKVTCITNAGDGRLFITEAPGRIKFFDPYATGGVTSGTLFMNIVSRVKSSGNEQGLLGLAFAPDYATSGRFYVDYTNLSGNTVISRFTVTAGDPNTGNAASEEILLTITQPYSNHNGGNVAFGPDGYLYIGMGDGGSGGDPNGYAQNGASLLGKMLRIDVSGTTGYTIPPTNPFLTTGDNIRDEIWAKGVRNPWRYSFDKLTGDLWIGDVGQDVYEEVDLILAPDTGGQNYGWKCHEGLHPYAGAGCTVANRTEPVWEYAHGATNGCSITGGFVDRGVVYAALHGRYFVTDYCSGRIWSMVQNGTGGVTSADHGVFVSNAYTTFGQDMYGQTYLAEQTGKISRLSTTTGSPIAQISADGDLSFCEGSSRVLRSGFNPLLSYQWFLNDVAIDGATSSTFPATEGGNYTVSVSRTGAPAALSEVISLTRIAVPALSATSAFSEVCEEAAFPFTLTGTPDGGTFSGTGVTDSNFNPFQLGAGTYTVTYNYTTTDGCVATPVSFNIILNPLPVVTLSGLSNNYCIDSAIETLTVSPTGGTLYGSGISGDTFSAALAGLGEHIINYTYADQNACSATAAFTVNVDACLTTNELATSTIQIVPNPFHGRFTLKILGTSSNWETVEVLNMVGQRCFNSSIKGNVNNQSIGIDLSGQPAGIYFLRISGGTELRVIKLVQE